MKGIRRIGIILGLGLTVAAAAAFGADAAEPAQPLRRLALFIGSNAGGAGRTNLRYAEEDARAMAVVMHELGGVDAGDSLVLLAPTVDDVLAGFQTVGRRAQGARAGSRRVEFLLYYSGHSDEQGLLLGGERLDYPRLRSAIQEVQADVNIAVLDSCSSGAFTRLKGGTRQPPFLLDESAQMRGHAYLSSSSADEAAQESDRINGSFFTHFMISGLRGAADATRDGRISLNEVYHYAFNETLAHTEATQAGPQHPSYNIQLTGTGDLTLTDLRAASCGLRIEEQIEGRLFVRDARGRLVVELRKDAGTPVEVGLQEGRYRITLEQNRGLSEAAVELKAGRREPLSPRQFVPVRREPAAARGESPGEEERQPEAANRGTSPFVQPPPSAAPSAEAGAAEALLPPAPSAAPVSGGGPLAAAEPIPPEVTRVPFNIGIVPFVSLAGGGRYEYTMALNLLIGNSYAVDGVELAGVMNITDSRASGVQAAGVGNILGGELYGAQFAGVFNIVSGDTRAIQSAGVFNIVAGRGSFIESAGVFNINAGPFTGVLAAGVFNIVRGRAAGLQVAGVFNILDGPLSGIQAAGVFNTAGPLSGAQVGLVNIGGQVRGAQVGLVNIASGDVRGTQIGLVNICRRLYGLPVGLVNVSRRGNFRLAGWIAGGPFGYLGLQASSGWLYTLLYGGAGLSAAPSMVAAGAGIGMRLPLGSFQVEADLSAQHVFEGNPSSWETGFRTAPYSPVFPAARVVAGWKLVGSLRLLGGLMMNGHIPGATAPTPLHSGESWNLRFGEGSLILYPRLLVGLQI